MKNSWLYSGAFFAVVAMPSYADIYSALQNIYDNNPIIASGRSAVEGARADLSSARTEYKPYLGLTANIGLAHTSMDLDDTTLDAMAGGSVDYVPKGVGIVAQQNVFQGGATIANVKGAKRALEAQNAKLYATESDVFLSAINAYIDVLNKSEILKLNENTYKVLKKYHENVSDRQKVGQLTKTDVATAWARVQGAEYNVALAKAEYDNAVETFKRIYGDGEVSFSDIDMERVAAHFPDNVDTAEEYAIKNHPVILALEAQEAAVKTQVTVARHSMLPSVDLRASATQYNDLPYIDRVRDGRVGVYLSVPLYDKGNAFANVDKVRAASADIQDQIINARRTIVEQLHQAWNMYDAQKAAMDAADANVKASQMALSGTRDEQKRGRRTVLDVLNAEQEVLNAQVALSRAQYGKTSAYFSILAASGKLTPDVLGIKSK